MNKSGLIIVPPASFLIFLLTLPLALRLWRLLHTWCSPRLLHCRASLLWLRSLYLALRRWCLLHTRCSPRLLPLTLDCRASLLRRGFDRGWSLNLFATTLLWLRSLYLALRLWCLLHTRCRPRLLPLFLDYRASLLGRGLDRGWSLNLFATTLLWLRACAGRSTLLERL
jgi:hypothetical protein